METLGPRSWLVGRYMGYPVEEGLVVSEKPDTESRRDPAVPVLGAGPAPEQVFGANPGSVLTVEPLATARGGPGRVPSASEQRDGRGSSTQRDVILPHKEVTT